MSRFHYILVVIVIYYSNYNSLLCQSEDFDWWNTHVMWDGETHWSEYLTYSPAFFGPHALPVPAMGIGEIQENNDIRFTFHSIFSKEEKTQSIGIYYHQSFADQKISFFGSFVAAEHFQIEEKANRERRSRDFDGKGWAIGDLWMGTSVSLLHDHDYIPDLLFTTAFKTSLGTNRAAARFTDAGAYSFDISVGKSYHHEELVIRPSMMLGLYVYQTNEEKNPQNDAILYGAGVNVDRNSLHTSLHVSGYSGYKDNGDKPIEMRLQLSKSWNRIQIGGYYTYRLRDFSFHRISVSIGYSW